MSWIQPSLITKGKGAAQSKYFQIRIGFLKDVANYPTEIDGSVELSGNYVLQDGKYFTDLQVSASKTSLPTTGEGEEDNISLSSLPEFYAPGSSVVLENFIQNAIGESVIVFVRVGSCGANDSFWYQYGSCAAPLTLIPEGANNNDGTGYLLKFQQFAKTDKMPKRYYGTFTLATVTGTVAADATTIDVTNGPGEYQLADNTAATDITDLTNASNNAKYTVLGSGGSNPATITNGGNFILLGGVDWQGLAGTSITFNAIDAGSGDHVFIETARS